MTGAAGPQRQAGARRGQATDPAARRAHDEAVQVAGDAVPTARTSREAGGLAGPDRWKQRYARRLVGSDVTVVAVAIAATAVLRATIGGSLLTTRSSPLVETVISVVLGLAWLGLLSIYGTRDLRVLGTGTGEVRRVADATLRVFGVLALVAAVLGQVDAVRAHLLVSFPLGLVLVVLTRWQWRRWLVRQRRTGRYSSTVVVVGGHRSAVVMARTFAKDPAAGFRVVGACVPGHGRGGRRASDRLVDDDQLVPVLGDESTVAAAIRETGADTVVVTATEQLGHDGMRALAWELQALGVDLVVTPGMVDVVGQRLQIRPMASLPLVHVAEPQYEGASRVRKRLFDVAVAVTVLVLSSPLLLAAAVAVKVTSPGPVVYKGERIGRNGDGFPMMKFRSMVADADTLVIELAGANEAAGPLFKIRGDPRITPVGAFMRKFSVDELPQLVNVLRGEMSIVGPRPPLRREVETYTGEVHRRLLVRPGITGLWQVSGRSDLTWDESVRLDLSYVENWSMTADVAIVARTLKAVLASDGAY